MGRLALVWRFCLLLCQVACWEKGIQYNQRSSPHHCLASGPSDGCQPLEDLLTGTGPGLSWMRSHLLRERQGLGNSLCVSSDELEV